MCLIIDANCASKYANGDASAAPVIKWLLKIDSRLAIGGTKLGEEYAKVSKFLKLLSILNQRGQLNRCKDEDVDLLENVLMNSGSLKSDDAHIIALASLKRCRLLYSNDENLHDDFTALSDPKGKVYQTADHAHLLAGAPRCI